MRCIYSCYIVMLSQHIISFEYRRTRERDSRLRRKKSLPTDNVCMYVCVFVHCMDVYVCVYCIYVCLCICTHDCFQMFIYIYVCMFVCMRGLHALNQFLLSWIHEKYSPIVCTVFMYVCIYVCAGRLGTKKILTGLHSDAASKLLNWLLKLSLKLVFITS